MSVSSEVQRTLVKSPPELWAELSDPTTLARHLGELGEIRIVGTEPERTVEWTAAAADGVEVSGRVEIKPSGWGTRVTLSASRLVPEPEAQAEAPSEATSATEPAVAPSVAPVLEPLPSSVESVAEPLPSVELGAEPQPSVEAEPEPEPLTVDEHEHEPRKGFFARIFRRRHPEHVATEPQAEPEPGVEPEPDVEPEAASESEPEPESAPQTQPEQPDAVEIEGPASEVSTPDTDIAAELTELEEQTTAVLTGVLDRLGAAHHRPFSRS